MSGISQWFSVQPPPPSLGVLPEELDGGVQNPYHIYSKHDSWSALVDDLINSDEKVASSKNISSSRVQKWYQLRTKMSKIDTL